MVNTVQKMFYSFIFDLGIWLRIYPSELGQKLITWALEKDSDIV